MSCVTCHMSGVACHFLTIPNRKSYGPAYCLIMFTIPYHTIPHHTTMCHVSRITSQMSHLTCHLSCITSQVLHVTHFLFFFLLESGGVSWWSVCYKWGLPRLVFRLFLIKNSLIPKIYLFQLVVVRFWSLKKAN